MELLGFMPIHFAINSKLLKEQNHFVLKCRRHNLLIVIPTQQQQKLQRSNLSHVPNTYGEKTNYGEICR
ncbi:MAG: hypothetical protein RI955_258 [Bacteroidota bacterium]